MDGSIDPGTSLGAVALAVSDVERARAFYQRIIGLRVLAGDGDAVSLGADGPDALVELTGGPDVPRRPPRTTGLFHLAILVPTRVNLARALRRAVGTRWPLSGASDHLVSEALYLADPDGNGIEIYRDRPREDWGYEDGELQMATRPLDLEDLAGELRGDEAGPDGLAPGTRIGHVHLRVADLPEAEAFYHGVLGFDVVVRTYPGALFLSAGGYHHHIGLNTWAGEGAPPPPPGSTGLRHFEVVLPGREEFERVAQRAQATGAPAENRDGGLLVRDPSHNGVLLTVRARRGDQPVGAAQRRTERA